MVARQMLLSELDPIEERRKAEREVIAEKVRTITFEQACEQYIAAHEASWRNLKHRKQWRSSFATYAWPTVGKLAVAVTSVLEPIWRTKTETASRLRGRIENVLGWATVRGFREGENPARWRGHLDALLPARSKVQRVQHHSALSYAEIGSFMAVLRERAGFAAIALEFTILTAARSGEVLSATWDEIDLTRRVWTVPAERIEILSRLAEVSDGSGYVFFGRKGRPLSSMAMLQLLKRMERSDVTVHGFRSCFRDWAGDCTNHPREVAEGCLAHIVKGVEAAYRRSDALEKRRRLLQAWTDYCGELHVETDHVIPIRGREE